MQQQLLRKSILLFLLVGASLSSFGQSTNQALKFDSVPALQQHLSNFVNEARFAAAEWGVKVASLDTDKTIFEHNSQKLLSPASNSKLYTVALALDRLGADYRLETVLYASRKPGRNGTLKGNLIVYGQGDPTISARLHGGDILQALNPLVEAVARAGIKRVKGGIIGDTTFFRGPELGAGWAWDDSQEYYGAEISALTINDNTIEARVAPGGAAGQPCHISLFPATDYLVLSNRTITTSEKAATSINFFRPPGGNVVYVTGRMALGAQTYSNDVPVHNPAGLFVSWFKQALERRGIRVDGPLRTLNWPRDTAKSGTPGGMELGRMESLPLRDIAREVQKPSQNLYTDLLLAHVGEKARGGDDCRRSEDLGIRELDLFLAQAGVPDANVFFEEGSGLSRNNVTTPNATVALLRHMAHHPCAQVYLDALPVAGVDGTLRNRMKGTAAEGNLRGKTGTLRWANSLSGHVQTAAGERLIFSIMLNRYHSADRARSARSELDHIAVCLANFSGRTEP